MVRQSVLPPAIVRAIVVSLPRLILVYDVVPAGRRVSGPGKLAKIKRANTFDAPAGYYIALQSCGRA